MRERSPFIKTALLGDARSLLRDLENELPPEITPDRFAGELKDDLHRLHGLGWRPNHIADRLAAVAPGLTAADVAQVLGLDADAATVPPAPKLEAGDGAGDDDDARDPHADDDEGFVPDALQEAEAPPALMGLDMDARPDPSLLEELADDEDSILSALNDLAGSMDAEEEPGGGTKDEEDGGSGDDAPRTPRFIIDDADADDEEDDEDEDEDETTGIDDSADGPDNGISDFVGALERLAADDNDEDNEPVTGAAAADRASDDETDDDLDIDALDLSADDLDAPSPVRVGGYRSETDDDAAADRDADGDEDEEDEEGEEGLAALRALVASAQATDDEEDDNALDDQLSGILSRLKQLGDLADEPAEPEAPPPPATGPVRLRVELPADQEDRYRDQFLQRGFIQQDDGSWITTALQPADAGRFELKLSSIGGVAERVAEATTPPKTGAKKTKTATRSRKKAAS